MGGSAEGSRFSVAESLPSGILKLTLLFGVPGYGLKDGPVRLGSQLDGNPGTRLLLSPQIHPENIPGVDFQLGLCVDSQIVFHFGLWTVFNANSRITFCAGFYFGYEPAAFPSFHCQVCPDHSADLQWFP